MKTICIILLAVIYSFDLNAQTHFLNSSYPNLNPLKIKNAANLIAKNDSSNFGENFPFQFGVDFGALMKRGSEEKIPFELAGYMDINTWSKIIFGKIKYGQIIFTDKPPLRYISLSGMIKYADIGNQHKLYAGVGFCAVGSSSKHEGVVSVTGYWKYLYVLNKYLGITGGINLVLGSSELFWENFMLEVGFQVFH